MIKNYDLIRKNDQYFIALDLEVHNSSEYCTISFVDNLNIIETSKGFISENSVYLHKPGTTSLQIVKLINDRPIDCIVSFFNGTTLISSTSYTINLELIKEIKHNQPLVMEIPTITNKYQDKTEYLNTNLPKIKSSWKCHLTVQDDVVIDIVSSGNSKIQVAIGENTEQLCSSDYVFSLLPGLPFINVPKEIMWSKYSLYTQNSIKLFELMRPDFISNQNILYKIPISNSIDINQIPKKNHTFSECTDIMDNQLSDNWSAGKLGLPVQKVLK